MEITEPSDGTAETTAWDVPPGRAVQWLSEVLRMQVQQVKPSPLVTCISLGTLQKLSLVLKVNDKLSKTSLVLKTESANAGANSFAAKAKCYSTEHVFYTKLSQKCMARVPRCLYSSISPDEKAATLLLQHIIHATPGDIHVGLTLDQAKAAAEELGRLHASYFDDDDSMNLVRSAVELVLGFDGKAALESFLFIWGDLLDPFTDESGNNYVRAVFEHCAAHGDNWRELLQLGIPSIAHGDYKGTNLMFGDTGERATILDFQTLYKGGEVARADDLNYLLVGSMETISRAENERALVIAYRDSLEGSLPPERKYDFFPSEEELMQYYKMATQGMVYRCLNFNLILGKVSREVSRLQLHSLVTRTTLAIIDHGLHISLHVGSNDAKPRPPPAPNNSIDEINSTTCLDPGCRFGHNHSHDHSH